MSLPVVDQSTHHTAALLDYLARRMRLRAESALAPLRLRPRHLVALTMLRDLGTSTQEALATTLQIDRTNLVGLLNELEREALYALLQQAISDHDAIDCAGAVESV
jgi:DNA-binding MarR family transcriptional regulator